MTTVAHAHTILIVDDERLILRVFGLALERAGYRVKVAENADDAIACVRGEAPDAILIDLTMPYVNGLGLIYRLREIASQIPIALITGAHVTDETREELDTLGVAL